MADYYQLKNQNIFNPPANTSLGNTSNQFGNAFVQNDLILGNVTVTGATIVTPKVSTIGYPGDDTAADPAGGQTITLTGSGFLVGASVLINGSAVGVVSVVSSTTITFTSPANSAGSYVLYVINTDGGTAIAIPGIQYSGVPTWTTAAGSLGSVYETESFNQSVTATGDAPITYSLFSGSIPPGATFNSNGTITGTSQLLSSSTTYTFTVRATDAEAQDTNRSFSLTISPDVVTWSSPANGTTYTSALNSAISNVTLVATSAVGSGITYTANALPVGLSLTGANISGTPTVEANSSSLLTATANTTSESSSITINWAINVANDAYFEYNTLLIPGASTTFVDDASTNNFAVTIFGDTKPNSFNPYTPGYYSNYFDGTGDYLTVPLSTALALSANYTIECWIYPTVAGQKGIYTSIDSSGDSWQGVGFEIYTNNCPRAIGWSGGSSSMDLVHQTSVVLNTWNHIALCRNNNLTYLYLNGVQSTSSSADSTSYAQSGSTIGQQYPGSSQPYTGYISNLRVVKGTAVYTAAFTPPTSPLTAIANTSLLTCQSNSIIDNSTNAFTLTVGGDTSVKSFDPFVPNTSYSTYGSGYFDGTGDYLTVPDNVALQFGSATNFTMELWFYPTATISSQILLAKGTGGDGFELRSRSSGGGNYFSFWAANGASAIVQANVTFTLNTWQHLAVVRSSGTMTLYKNGVNVGSASDSTNFVASGSALRVAVDVTAGNIYSTGYITDLRIVKGTAVYTTAFTPPSAPLTAIANTSLLTLQNNQSVNNSVFLDNSTNNFFVTRAGNTTQGTFSPYGGNWSNYFDGTGDYLTTPITASGPLDLGSGSWTVEAWVMYTGSSLTSAYRNFLTFCNNSGLPYLQFGTKISTGYVFAEEGTQVSVPWTLAGTTLLTSNVWHHIATVRNGTTISIYLDGVLQASTFYSGTIQTFAKVQIGSLTYNGSVIQDWTGYISNARIVKGIAVYTSAFTPSTTPLTPITNTSLLTCQSPRFIDNSINNFTLTKAGDTSVQRFSPFNPSSVTPTSYSGYFDGTGDYLNAPSNAVFGFGTGDFTIEGWFYFTGTIGTYQRPWWFGDDNDNIEINGSVLRVGGASQGTLITGGTTIVASTWYHIALTRASGSYKLWLNGSQQGSTATNSYNSSARTFTAMATSGGANPSTGYVSNLRIVKGTAVYTTTFTPSTTPLTAVSGTSLLTLQSTTFIDNSTNNLTLTPVGNSQPSIQNPFGFTSATSEGYTVSTIGGSGYFDGSGDYLTVPRSTLCIPGASQNFTIEAWVYSERAAGVTAQQIMGFHASGSSSDWILYISGSNYPIFYIDAIGTSITSSIIVNPYSWNHIAVVRKDTNTITLYVNGVAGGTATSTSTLTGSGANPLSIGSDYNGVNYVTKGYISNGRIVNGTALYTSNFVPPSAPLTAVQNTTLLTNMTSAGIYDAAMMTTMETVGNPLLSTAVSKFGGSSMSFGGSQSILFPGSSMPSGAGTAFTVEFWINAPSYNSFAIMRANGNGSSLAFSTNSSSQFVVSNVFSSDFYTSTTALSPNVWTHVAIVRNSANLYTVYFNGTSAGTAVTYSGVLGTVTQMYIAYNTYNGYYSTFYMDDLRITPGVARYTSNFTAPTSAFPIF